MSIEEVTLVQEPLSSKREPTKVETFAKGWNYQVVPNLVLQTFTNPAEWR